MEIKWQEEKVHTPKIRLLIVTVFFTCIFMVIIFRLFQLQIIHGEDYLNNFELKIEKTKQLPAVRGNIYDCYGNLLAYTELAYSVTIEDVYSGITDKSIRMNSDILKTIQIVEKNGDKLSGDFAIGLDENNEYVFLKEGSSLLRFRADIYGHSLTSSLTKEELEASAADMIEYMCSKKKYMLGDYETIDGKKQFIPMLGFTKDEIIKILTVRFSMSANSYQKYILTTIATDVSESTIAAIMENKDMLLGISIEEDTVRRYVDSKYFANILGYTGKISQEELDKLKESDDTYSINDYVGKTGIEATMELELSGTKGIKTIYVNNVGSVTKVDNVIEPVAGNDVYLTIDKNLQIAAYNILEQKLAGILVSKIKNVKTQTYKDASEIIIPIYDVYFALINNNVIDISKFRTERNLGENEQAVYDTYKEKEKEVFNKLYDELTSKKTIYDKLSDEYKVYESFIVSKLNSNKIIDPELLDKEDKTYIDWAKNEIISLHDYLKYCISMNWIDTTRLDLDGKYSDSDEVYDALITYIFEMLGESNEFSKKTYKYMIYDGKITGKQICLLLWEQDVVDIDDAEIERLSQGKLKAFDFMVKLIEDIKITPAQLALDPCTASCVITDVKTAEVKAMVSYPGYDNNKLANSIDREYYNKLQNDLSIPLWNYATQQRTAPGSTFKPLTAIAGLNEGYINQYSLIECTGVFDKLTATPQKCLSYHGKINVVTAIEKSCNCFFYETAYRMCYDGNKYNASNGLEVMGKYADLFGLSDLSGIEIAEAAPQFSTEYPITTAIGQANHNYTTVGLARYATTLANSGTCYNLTLLSKLEDADHNIIKTYTADVRNTVELDQNIWDLVHKGMRNMILSKSYFTDVGVDVAGKTGTAQQVENRGPHALFIGYAPYDDPEIAICTRIAFGYTSSNAAEASKNILKYYFNTEESSVLLDGKADKSEYIGRRED